jgi:hypothetical protein
MHIIWGQCGTIIGLRNVSYGIRQKSDPGLGQVAKATRVQAQEVTHYSERPWRKTHYTGE